MKKFLILLIFLVSISSLIVSTAFAVSPMPEEIEKGIEKKSLEKSTDTVCMAKIIYTNDATSGKPLREDFSYSVVMKGPVPKKDAIEKTVGFIEDKLKEDDISEVKIECRFPELKAKEQ